MTAELKQNFYGRGGRGEELDGIPPGYVPVRTRDGEIILVPEEQLRQQRRPRPPVMKLEKSLKDEFEKAVNGAIKDFEHLKGRFIFVNVPESQVIADIERGRSRVARQEHVDAIVKDLSADAKEAMSSMAGIDPRIGVYTLAYTPAPFRLFTEQGQPFEMEAMATFFHELGHIVAPNAIGSPTMALPENVADIYGILRHIQKYGSESKAIEIGSWSRALQFVLHGQGDHFTTLSIDAMPKILEKLDVNALTPVQTTMLASRIALMNTPHIDAMASVAQAFQNVMPTIEKSGDLIAGLKIMAETTLKSEGYYTFRIGASALKRFLDNKVVFDKETQLQLFGRYVNETDTGVLKLEGAYWDDVRQRMKDRTAQLEKEGVLLGMPHLAAGQTPAHLLPPATPVAPAPKKDDDGWSFRKLFGGGGPG